MYTQSDLLKSVEKLKAIKQESEVKLFFVFSYIEEHHCINMMPQNDQFGIFWNEMMPSLQNLDPFLLNERVQTKIKYGTYQ